MRALFYFCVATLCMGWVLHECSLFFHFSRDSAEAPREAKNRSHALLTTIIPTHTETHTDVLPHPDIVILHLWVCVTNLELMEFAVIRLIHFNYPHGISYAPCHSLFRSVTQIVMHGTLSDGNKLHRN